MPTSYTITMTMNDHTVAELSAAGSQLYCFKGANAPRQTGVLVWLADQDYSQNTCVAWTGDYQAFTSKSSLAPGHKVVQAASYSIELGDTLHVENERGIGVVEHEGLANAFSVYNETDTPMVCGLSQKAPDLYHTLCACVLHGKNDDRFQPVEKVLLMFAEQSMEVGTVVETALEPGLLVDLAHATNRDVGYHIDEGWSWDGTWGTAVAVDEPLAAVLLGSEPGLSRGRRGASAGGRPR